MIDLQRAKECGGKWHESSIDTLDAEQLTDLVAESCDMRRLRILVTIKDSGDLLEIVTWGYCEDKYSRIRLENRINRSRNDERIVFHDKGVDKKKILFHLKGMIKRLKYSKRMAVKSCDTALKDFMSGRLSYEDYQDMVSAWELHLESISKC